MYNLLVANAAEEWNGEPVIEGIERCINVHEYTDKKNVKKYGDLSPAQIDEIIQFPCIFAYETQCHKNPKFGYIREIVKRKEKVKIHYEIIPLEKFLTQDELEEMHFELDIHGWEYNRTHWAIKDVDLQKELLAKEIYLPQSENTDERSQKARINEALDYVSPTLIEPKQIDLIERLKQCQPGKQDCYKYESICIEILTKVFVPPLKSPRIQARTLNGLERRDALISLRGATQGWEEIRQEFEAKFLLCEFKNYVDPFNKDEVNQTRNYLRKDAIGRLGIIFSRKGASESAKSMRNSVYSQERRVILFFEDQCLIELLRMKEAGRNPLDLIQDAIEDFLISYE